ncbi:phosphonate ABC transporter substrate-binding protein [Flexistipes sinusarabici]|uniref:phosphonate ABC transporter substrate-binding protein n=1 Tax=Flexistipes sinusarabici TaxID=2352 RepID=UPI00235590E3|nr:phosphonate ABC transporter substrate-binding protein [Flexistipes sinusarabici]
MFATLVLGISSAHADSHGNMPEQINFGIIPTESTTALGKSFKPFFEDMEDFLGIPVKPFFASDYAGIIQGMRFDKVDIAWYGNKSAIEAVDRAGGEVFVQTIKDDGTRGYYSHLITYKGSGVDSLEDVLECDKTLTFSNGDPNSTSGFAIPGYYVWAKNGITPEECFKRVTSSNHGGNAVAVATEKVHVATNNNESLYRFSQQKPELAKNIKVIWTSPIIPSDPIVWRKNLSEKLKEKIVYFFIQYGRYGSIDKIERERKVLSQMSDGWGPFLASSNAQLLDVRKIEAFKKKLKAENNNDKDALREAEAEIKRLEKLSKIYGTSGY